jgi:hypothetical protein
MQLGIDASESYLTQQRPQKDPYINLVSMNYVTAYDSYNTYPLPAAVPLMGKGIERKFLVNGDSWRSLGKGIAYRQRCLNSVNERTVRIRTIGGKAFLTVKGLTAGATRDEYEYEIPLADCNKMLDTLAENPIIDKKHYEVPLISRVAI